MCNLPMMTVPAKPARAAKRLFLVCALALGFSIAAGSRDARADDFFGEFEFHPYVGLDLGYLLVDYTPTSGYGNFLPDRFFTVDLQLGARLHRYLGVELGVFRSATGEEDGQAVISMMPVSTGTEVDIQGAYLDLLGYYPLTDSDDNDTGLEFVGSIGIARINAEGDVIRGPTLPLFGSSEDETDTAIRYSLGAQYHFTETLTVRAMYRYIDVDFNDTVNHGESANLGVRYSF